MPCPRVWPVRSPAVCGMESMTTPRPTRWKWRSCSARTASIWNCRITASGIRQLVNQSILRIHQETGIPMVCTNDAHYLRKGGCRGSRHPAVHPDRQNRGRREPDALRASELLSPQRGGDGDAVRGLRGRTGKHPEDRGACAIWSLPSASTTCRNSSCRRGMTAFPI